MKLKEAAKRHGKTVQELKKHTPAHTHLGPVYMEKGKIRPLEFSKGHPYSKMRREELPEELRPGLFEQIYKALPAHLLKGGLILGQNSQPGEYKRIRQTFLGTARRIITKNAEVAKKLDPMPAGRHKGSGKLTPENKCRIHQRAIQLFEESEGERIWTDVVEQAAKENHSSLRNALRHIGPMPAHLKSLRKKQPKTALMNLVVAPPSGAAR
ncbi:MAG: hypothetical protein LAN84_12195 [Acidobacteriia bacterium]|nr:hypothetical protein [Terriglobia bacterium]